MFIHVGGMTFYTYIMSCWSNTAIYIGVASDLSACITEHKLSAGPEHTAKYKIVKLIYYEMHPTLAEAIARERKLTRWRRSWKEALIAGVNPSWSDLSRKFVQAKVPDQARDEGITNTTLR